MEPTTDKESLEDLFKTYQDHPEELLKRALEKLADFPYVVSLSDIAATATVFSMKATQAITAYDFYTPSLNYNESYSSSAFIQTKARFYDHHDGKILGYQAKGKESLANSQPKTYDYNSYIHAFGKLEKLRYYVVNRFSSKDSLIHDGYLSDRKEDYLASSDTTKRVIYGSIPYQIEKDTLKSAGLALTKEGDLILTFDLDVKRADDYFATKMVTTGSLNDFPKFSLSQIEVRMTPDLVIKAVKTHDIYHARTGFINADIEMTGTTLFFAGYSPVFKTQDQKPLEVSVPLLGEEFNGAKLK